MGDLRKGHIETIWRGQDPFAGFPRHLYQVDAQGWGETHHYLTETIGKMRPRAVAEIGVWKGASTIVMARELQRLGIDGVVFAIDSWLGSVEHWIEPHYFASLNMVHGYPALQRKFMANMLAHDVQDVVVPLPLDSINAANLLAHHGISLDMIHLDAGHDVRSVTADLAEWWPRLKPGGVLIGDDYHAEHHWPGVKQAFDAFMGPLGLVPLEHVGGKCRVTKPAAS